MAQQYPPGSANPKYQPLKGPANLSPQNVGATAPAPYGQFGNIPTIDPTYWQSANANPFQQQQYLKQYNQMYAKGLDPTFDQQDLSLNQDLASRGIQDSSAASSVMGNLYAQQGGQIAQGEAPMVQQAFAQTQQDVLANQAAQNAANSGNAAAANAASGQNAQYYYDTANQNMNAYNAYQNSLFGAGTNEQNSLMAAYLNSFGPQTGVTNAFSQAMGGINNAYGQIYQGASQGQGGALGGVGQGLGTYFGDMAMAGA
jgi:hypothetical protein